MYCYLEIFLAFLCMAGHHMTRRAGVNDMLIKIEKKIEMADAKPTEQNISVGNKHKDRNVMHKAAPLVKITRPTA